jgi:hypothetical protein
MWTLCRVLPIPCRMSCVGDAEVYGGSNSMVSFQEQQSGSVLLRRGEVESPSVVDMLFGVASEMDSWRPYLRRFHFFSRDMYCFRLK